MDVLLAPHATLLRIPGAVTEALSSESDGGRVSALKEKVEAFNTKYKKVASPTTSTPAGAGSAGTAGAGAAPPGPTVPARTLSQPQFSEGDTPFETGKTISPSTVLDLSEFEATKELLGKEQQLSAALGLSVRQNFNLKPCLSVEGNVPCLTVVDHRS